MLRLFICVAALLLVGCQNVFTQARQTCEVEGWDSPQCEYAVNYASTYSRSWAPVTAGGVQLFGQSVNSGGMARQSCWVDGNWIHCQ